MGGTAEAGELGDVGEFLFAFAYHLGGTIELVGLEEGIGRLARQALYLVVELRTAHHHCVG